MRLLNSGERAFCNQLAGYKTLHFYFGDLVDQRLKQVAVRVDTANRKVWLLVPAASKEESERLRFEAISELIVMVTVLELLEKDGYVLLYRVSGRTQEHYEFGPKQLDPATLEEVAIIDDRTVTLLCKYSRKDIIPTDEFRRFCSRGFIARDEQRFQRQIHFTVGALAVSTLLLVLNMAFTFWPKMSGESKKTLIKLDSMITDIHDIRSTLFPLKKPDTLKTK